MHPSIPLMSGMHNKSQQSSWGDDRSQEYTSDFSFGEVQVFKVFQFRNRRWNLCNAQQKSEIIMG
jgi:hypothetical protein